jgi:uncharacterized protein YbjT (DUF2867 family)
MKVLVTTPTGHIGRVVASNLLDARADVTVYARHPEKVKELAARGARVHAGDLHDGAALSNAAKGMDAIFWLTPPSFGEGNFLAYVERLGRAGAAAVKKGGVQRVVNLSSYGAHLPDGTGPIQGLGRVEKLLEDAAPHVTHVRAAFFMENYLGSLDTMRRMGSIFFPAKGSTRIGMIATRDIGAFAARRLLDSTWSGRVPWELFGPADYSFDEAAAIFSRVLGERVRHVTVTREQAIEALVGMGIHANLAALYVEMYEALDAGLFEREHPVAAEHRTGTSLEEFTREVILPAFKGAGVSS